MGGWGGGFEGGGGEASVELRERRSGIKPPLQGFGVMGWLPRALPWAVGGSAPLARDGGSAFAFALGGAGRSGADPGSMVPAWAGHGNWRAMGGDWAKNCAAWSPRLFAHGHDL